MDQELDPPERGEPGVSDAPPSPATPRPETEPTAAAEAAPAVDPAAAEPAPTEAPTAEAAPAPPPAAEPTPAEAVAAAPPPAPSTAPLNAAPREGTSALRAQLARERAQGWRAQPNRTRLHTALAVLVAVLLGGYLLRLPVYRAVARQGGPFADWAVGKLIEARDPASFELYLHQMGTPEGRDACGELVYLLAGRDRLPPPLAEDEEPEDAVAIPEDPEAIAEHSEALARALEAEDYPELQLGALYTLNYLTSRDWERWERSEELLVLASQLLAHPEDAHRRLAALVLTTRPAPPAAQPALVRAADAGEPDARVRAFAVEALAQLEDPAFEPTLSRALEDPDPLVRGAAKQALARLGEALSVEQLAALVRGDGRLDAVAELIAEKDGPRATELLLQLSQHPDVATRREALRGLSERDEAAARRALEGALTDRDPQVRVFAAIRLREREDGVAALPALGARMASWSDAEPDTGWNELLELHRSLKALTGEDVRPPTPDPASWELTQRGWASVLRR
ncbi:MAG: HEAT repeat domain-containing protein [Planctomycetota bacterium]